MPETYISKAKGIMKLRGYQESLIENVRGAIRRRVRRLCIVSPTGSGKTVMFSFLSSKTALNGKRVMILVHRKELVEQVSETLANFDVEHGIIAAGFKSNPFKLVQVCSVQTLVSRLDKLSFDPDVIIIDECHHASAGTWKTVLGHFPNAIQLGFTATPERLDGKGLSDCFDQIILGPTVSELIEWGNLCPPKYFCPELRGFDRSALKKSGGDFQRASMVEMLDKPQIVGDAIDHYRKICPGVPAVAFCVSVAAAENLASAFRDAGVKSETIDGTLDKATRKDRVEALKDGRIQVLTSCEIISEGFDIPKVTAAILLRPTQSLGMHLQQIGRVLRPSIGKSHSIVLDHVGNCRRHGFAEDAREWKLEGREKKKRNRDAVPALKHCPKCFIVHPPSVRVCPNCGHERPVEEREVEEVEGELKEVKAEELAQLINDRKRKQGQAEGIQALIRLGRSRGMRNPEGWAYHVHAARMRKRGHMI